MWHRRLQRAMPAQAKLLLVDDEPDILETLSEALALVLPVSVDTAPDAGAAMAKLARGTYRMVIADEQMPGMTGLHLLSWVEQQDPRALRVLITAFPRGRICEAAAREGVPLHFHKPLSLRMLSGELGAALRGLPAAGCVPSDAIPQAA
jgi:DNA-binding NtrC family response regulator